LVGATLTVDGLVAPMSVVVRVVFADGSSVDGLLAGADARFDVPAAPSRLAVARDYLRLGLEHIATGPDHLLFVFGLVLLASTLRRLLATVTAFTVGHSLTLALATFGLVRVPARPVELLIALSVLWVAIEVARREGSEHPAGPEPWTMAGGFGLLHGLGFASVLSNAGLGAGALVLGLLAFNVGIEIGQLAFVLFVLALTPAVRRLLPLLPAWTTRVPLYVMGTLAAYWCFDRAAAWWAVG
jgi:hydrogenase/urease accessory protein HupE